MGARADGTLEQRDGRVRVAESLARDARRIELEGGRARRVRLQRRLPLEERDQPRGVTMNDGVRHAARADRAEAPVQLERAAAGPPSPRPAARARGRGSRARSTSSHAASARLVAVRFAHAREVVGERGGLASSRDGHEAPSSPRSAAGCLGTQREDALPRRA